VAGRPTPGPEHDDNHHETPDEKDLA